MDNPSKTLPRDDREIIFTGAVNCRDLGGLETISGRMTRRGVVYRCDSLARLTDADVRRLAKLGLRSIFDLRGNDERRRAPSRLPDSRTPQIFEYGFVPRGTHRLFRSVNESGADPEQAAHMMQDNYARMPFAHAVDIARTFHAMLEPGALPAMIHCMSGKDRTGVVCALMLLAVGVPTARVLDDYALSNREHQPVDVFAPTARSESVAVIMSARRDFLQATIDAITGRCGTIELYCAEHLKFGATQLRQLRAALLD